MSFLHKLWPAITLSRSKLVGSGYIHNNEKKKKDALQHKSTCNFNNVDIVKQKETSWWLNTCKQNKASREPTSTRFVSSFAAAIRILKTNTYHSVESGSGLNAVNTGFGHAKL